MLSEIVDKARLNHLLLLPTITSLSSLSDEIWHYHNAVLQTCNSWEFLIATVFIFSYICMQAWDGVWMLKIHLLRLWKNKDIKSFGC